MRETGSFNRRSIAKPTRAQLVWPLVVAIITLVPILASGYDDVGDKRLRMPVAAAVPWEKPVLPAKCGPDDWNETGLQGSTSLYERESGLSELGFFCNLELVGQYQGEGAKYQMAWFDDCAYYATKGAVGGLGTLDPLIRRPGVVVVDAQFPQHPRPTAWLADPTMLDPHESLKVHQKRRLLAGVKNTTYSTGFPAPSEIAIYDVTDCRHPQLLSSTIVPGSQGHAGHFSADGMMYYGTTTSNGGLTAFDISDPRKPRLLGITNDLVHDLSTNSDGTRVYLARPGNGNIAAYPEDNGPNGLTILDATDFKLRLPAPQFRVVSQFYWPDGSFAQQTQTVFYRGRPHIIFTDENGSGGSGGQVRACTMGLPPNGYTRIIDISDEKHPVLVSKLMLEVSDPANCALTLQDPPGNTYSSHYCNVDRVQDPNLIACTYRDAGLRVFNIKDPYHPSEIAYYKPPARRLAYLPASQIYGPGRDRTNDHTPTQVRWRHYNGEVHLWFTSQDNGFQVVKFTNGVLRGLIDPNERFDGEY